MKEYVFVDNTWWDDSGWENECWNCEDIQGSCHSKEDAYVACLVKEGIPLYDRDRDCLYDYPLEKLEDLADEIGILVKFVEEADGRVEML